MSIFGSLSLILLINSFVHAQFRSTLCSDPTKGLGRREIHDLSPTDLTNYFAAVKRLQTKNSRGGSEYDTHVKVHVDNQATIHGFAPFLVWHRLYLRQYEMLVQKYCPKCTIPYWDWSLESQAPEKSVVFSNTYFGGNGSGSLKCVTNGAFSAWKPSYPRSHCMTRSFSLANNRIGALYSAELVNYAISTSKTYDGLRTAFEPTAHAAVHNNIGSDFSQMMSPNDPLFWSHHSFVDYVYDKWQWTAPVWNSYDGFLSNGRRCSTSDRLLPFLETANQALDCYYLCYFYVEKGVSYTPQRRQLGSTIAAIPAPKTEDLKDVSVKKDTASDDAKEIPEDDRQSLIKLRTPAQIPEQWLRKNNHNVKNTRNKENDFSKVYKSINSIPDYISPCALLSHPEVLKKLSNEEPTMKAHVDGLDLDLNLKGRKGKKAVDFVLGTLSYASKSVKSKTTGKRSTSSPKLTGIIGDLKLSSLRKSGLS